MKNAISAILLEELSDKDLNVVVALGNYKNLDMSKIHKLKSDFKNDSVTEPDQTNDRILQIHEFLQEEFNKILNKTINKSIEQLRIFIKKAATSQKVAAIKDDLREMINDYQTKKERI